MNGEGMQLGTAPVSSKFITHKGVVYNVLQFKTDFNEATKLPKNFALYIRTSNFRGAIGENPDMSIDDLNFDFKIVNKTHDRLDYL